jgi:hypothetical protein
MAFRFNECSTKAVAAFAEDYRVQVIAGGCRITWTLAQKLVGRVKLAMFVVRPLLNLPFRRFLTNLRRYTDARFARTARLATCQKLPRPPSRSVAARATASKVVGIVKSPNGVTSVSVIVSIPPDAETMSE